MQTPSPSPSPSPPPSTLADVNRWFDELEQMGVDMSSELRLSDEGPEQETSDTANDVFEHGVDNPTDFPTMRRMQYDVDRTDHPRCQRREDVHYEPIRERSPFRSGGTVQFLVVEETPPSPSAQSPRRESSPPREHAQHPPTTTTCQLHGSCATHDELQMLSSIRLRREPIDRQPSRSPPRSPPHARSVIVVPGLGTGGSEVYFEWNAFHHILQLLRKERNRNTFVLVRCVRTTEYLRRTEQFVSVYTPVSLQVRPALQDQTESPRGRSRGSSRSPRGRSRGSSRSPRGRSRSPRGRSRSPRGHPRRSPRRRTPRREGSPRENPTRSQRRSQRRSPRRSTTSR